MAGEEHVEVYRDNAGEWRYRVQYANGQFGPKSEEGFERAYAVHLAERHYPELPIVVIEPDDE